MACVSQRPWVRQASISSLGDVLLGVPSLDSFCLFCRVPGGGAGSVRNSVLGGSPLAKGMATTLHLGGGSLSSPATALRPALPLSTGQAQAQHQAASPPMGSCLRHSAQPTASQARNAVPTGTWWDPPGLALLGNWRRGISGTQSPGLQQSTEGSL